MSKMMLALFRASCLLCILLQTAAARGLLPRDEIDTHEWAQRKRLMLDGGGNLNLGDHRGDASDLQLVTSMPAHPGMSQTTLHYSSCNKLLKWTGSRIVA